MGEAVDVEGFYGAARGEGARVDEVLAGSKGGHEVGGVILSDE